MAATVDTEIVYAEVTRMPVQKVAQELNESLGATLVSVLAGSKDPKISYKWAKPAGPHPRDEAKKRLQLALRAWRIVSTSEGADVARMWFLGANPWLGEVSPVEAIGHDRSKEVMEAAMAMVEDRFAG